MRLPAWPRAALVAVCAAVSMVVASCAFGPPSSGHPLLGGSPSQTCAKCHREIYDEWRQSAHASAYTRLEFRQATHNYKDTDCLPCHVPASLDKLTKLPVRTAHLDEGVNCESCHLIGDAYAAPTLFSKYSNHKITVRKDLAASEFCGRCHKAIFEQWSAVDNSSNQRKTCQDCHMPIVHRKTVSGEFWHKLHKKADVRRHNFAMVKPASGKANVTVEIATGAISTNRVTGTVTLTNVAAHHSLPSGEFGFRELAVVIALTDRYGAASAKRVVRFLAQKKTYLPYGKPKTVAFEFDTVPSDAETLDVRLVRSAFSGVEAVLYHKRLPLRAKAEGK